jgi:hypothetical protein
MAEPDSGREALIPGRVAELNDRGLAKLGEMARDNPVRAKAAAEQLHKNPQAFVAHVFELTPEQYTAIIHTRDADFKQRIQPVLDALEKGEYSWTIEWPLLEAHAGPTPEFEFECTCRLKT